MLTLSQSHGRNILYDRRKSVIREDCAIKKILHTIKSFGGDVDWFDKLDSFSNHKIIFYLMKIFLGWNFKTTSFMGQFSKKIIFKAEKPWKDNIFARDLDIWGWNRLFSILGDKYATSNIAFYRLRHARPLLFISRSCQAAALRCCLILADNLPFL